MKKTTLLLTLLSSLTFFAQNNDFIRKLYVNNDSIQAVSLAKEIASFGRGEFTMVLDTLYKNKDLLLYRFEEKNKPKNYIMVSFYKTMEGANEDLEIEGVPKYKLSMVLGKYLDLAQTWKKHVNPTLDDVKVTEKSRTIYEPDTRGGHYIHFRKYNKNIWQIQPWGKFKE